jgi:hypothetical protein
MLFQVKLRAAGDPGFTLLPKEASAQALGTPIAGSQTFDSAV